jgi:hypothetical protein
MVKQMRRAFSILLVLFLGLGPLEATLLASGDARLPICCRRNGSHHCTMSEESLARIFRATSDATPTVGAPVHCPRYPGATLATISPVQAPASATIWQLAPSLQAHGHLLSRITILNGEARTLAVRGPPTTIFG